MNHPREAWVDAAKGIAICLVVFGHCWGGLWSSGLVSDALFEEVQNRIYAFHMPVFFALSGFFFAGSLKQATPWHFLKHRMLRLFWPMVLWTYLFLGVLAGQFANTPVTVSDVLTLPVPGQLHLWFLWALLLLHIGFLATRRFLDERAAYPPVILAGLAVLSIVLALISLPLEVAYWIGQALRFMPFFVLGIALRQLDVLSKLTTWYRVVAVFIFLGLLAIWPAVQVRALELAGGIALTTTFLVLVQGWTFPGFNLTVALGTASMAIFLAHTMFSAVMREGLLAFGQHDVALHIVLGFGVGILGPLITLKLADHFRLRNILGF
jgi:fucose 4-O-acetylase-like acetyltransferase